MVGCDDHGDSQLKSTRFEAPNKLGWVKYRFLFSTSVLFKYQSDLLYSAFLKTFSRGRNSLPVCAIRVRRIVSTIS